MKYVLYCSLLSCLLVNLPALPAHISLQERCRNILVKNPHFVEDVLPALHAEGNLIGDTYVTLPALRINNALFSRISMQSQRLQGHTGSVNTVAFSPDGRTLASGSSDCTIRLWDVVSGECLNILQSFQDAIINIAFSPNGAMLAAASRDNTITIWNIAKGECLHILQGSRDQINRIIFSPDGRMLASAGNDMIIRLWQAGECLHTLGGHTHDILSIAFNADGTILYSGSRDNTVSLWDTATGERLLTNSNRHGEPPSAIGLSSDGTSVAFASGHKAYLQMYESEIMRHEQTLWQMHYTTGITFSPDNKTIAATSSILSPPHDMVKIWNIATAKEQHILSHRDRVRETAFSPDNRTIAVATENHDLFLWTDYQADMQTITAIEEQRLLLIAAEDWFAGRLHHISQDNPILQELMRRFPYLNDRRLFYFEPAPSSPSSSQESIEHHGPESATPQQYPTVATTDRTGNNRALQLTLAAGIIGAGAIIWNVLRK